MDGTVFDIQHFSTHDGYGIRTTVFLKGCNNACLWCHNPEGLSANPQLKIYPQKCIGCQRCAEVCGMGCDPQKCISCGKCAEVCPTGAREMAGNKMTPEALYDEIKIDEAFYRNSGGGVTFSGGEPLLQAGFVAETAKICKQNGIGVGIQTAANVAWSEIEKVLPYTDFFMCDLKAFNDEIHKKYVGVSNRRIIENIQRLGGENIKLIVRTPVIGGVNENEIEDICKAVKDLKSLDYYELLRYHSFGRSKLESLNMTFGKEFEEPSLDTLRRLVKTAEKYIKTVKCNPVEEDE